MDTKRRRNFVLENRNGQTLARGILYDEGNCQLTWRADRGYTAEQYASIRTALGCMNGISVMKIN